MRGFSFVHPVLAGMPQPTPADLPFLREHGIRLLVSLTAAPMAAGQGMEVLHLPIVDFGAPTDEQQVAFVDAVRRYAAVGQRVGVHCTAGLGRTGTLLATWLVAEGLPAEQAIARIRELRRWSIETEVQEEAVRRFAVTWSQRR